MMFITGDLKIHKRTATRSAKAVVKDSNGDLAVYDALPEWFEFSGGQIIDREEGKIVEPDIIASADQYTRVERDGHNWNKTSYKSVMDEAERRDDVDEDELPDQI